MEDDSSEEEKRVCSPQGVLEEEGTNMVWVLEWGAFIVPLTLEEHVVRV